MTPIHHPARHFILYLFSKRIHDIKSVLEQMGELGLYVPVTDSFEFDRLTTALMRVKAGLRFPVPFNPRAKTPTPETLAWLRSHRVRDIWRGGEQGKMVAAATEILGEPHIRHLLELLLLGPLSMTAIADRVRVRFGLPPHAMHAGVVRAYAHYYWDTTALGPVEWRAFLSQYRKGEEDTYQAALLAPRSAAGAAFTVAIADRDPQLLSAAERYEAASSMAFGLMMHHSLSESGSVPSRTYAAYTALQMMRTADEQLALYRGASSDLIAEFARFETVYDKKPPISVTDATYIGRPVLNNPEVIDVPGDSEPAP